MRSEHSIPEPRGYILHETDDIVVIATLESDNDKTGNMIQVWILCRNESPYSAVHNGNDVLICFDCKAKEWCYVSTVTGGPNQVWRSYRAGLYPRLERAQYERVFRFRSTRFGAYGDPVLIPLPIIRAIVRYSDEYSGYTHQWRRRRYKAYQLYLMASCDSPQDYIDACALGWRNYRTRTKDQPVLPGETICPASAEGGYKTQCIRCHLCNGRKPKDKRKNIVNIVHGWRVKNFVSLEAIG